MKSQISEREVDLFGSNLPIAKPDILRLREDSRFDFSNCPRPKYVEERISQAIIEEIHCLNEQYRPEGKKASGKEIYEIKLRVREEHNARFIQSGIKLALWYQSERLLTILRTKGLTPNLDSATFNQRRLDWIAKLDLNLFPESDFNSSLGSGPRSSSSDSLLGYTTGTRSSSIHGANLYFELICPDLVRDFGYAFHASVKRGPQAGEKSKESIVGINTEFFAAYLSGQKRFGHDLIYFIPESKFYYFDPMVQQYLPTTEDKVRLGLSLTLQERAWGLEMDQSTLILNKFRSREVFDEILAKAKALLATESGFFEGPQAKPRFIARNQVAEDIATTIRSFIETQIAEDETSILTINDCVGAFKLKQLKSGLSTPPDREIKVLIKLVMRQVKDKSLRHDLVLANENKVVAGWRGLKLDDSVHQAVKN